MIQFIVFRFKDFLITILTYQKLLFHQLKKCLICFFINIPIKNKSKILLENSNGDLYNIIQRKY